MTRRFALTAFAFLLAVAATPAMSVRAAMDPLAFIGDLGRRALDVLSNRVSPAVREARFRQLYREDFDGPLIARFVLGRYWRLASPQEQREFIRLFEDYVVLAYATRLSNYSGEQFRVLGARPERDVTIVSSEILRPGGAPAVKVDWRLVEDGGRLKIADVVVDGISMAVTQRQEFASVIQRHGGQVGGLLSLMREKTAAAER
jgi:phospholipid transport system substrate-binding protein